MWDRTILECTLLQVTTTRLENLQEWKGSVWDVESHHFHKVCQSKKRGRRANPAQIAPQSEQDTHINENGVRQPNPPMVNMLKIVNHIGATRGSQEKHLKFPIDVDPRGPYKHHLVVRVDTGPDVNCMNEKTFKKLFPKVKLSVCPHEIQNFGNSVTDISILGQFCTYLQFRGEKYLNTFIVTDANDCPNLLSHGATFRMGVLLPNYPEENVVKGENVPNFKFDTSTGTTIGTSSNVFQILQDLWLKQYQGKCHSDPMQSDSKTFHRVQLIHLHRIWHNWQLLSGPPHPPQLRLEEQQQNRSIQYKYLKILHVRYI